MTLAIYFYKLANSIVTVFGEVMFYLKCLFSVFYYWKNNIVLFYLYMIKIDLFSLSSFILFVLFCIPGTCVFYNSWKKTFFLHSWSNNQLSPDILRKIFTMRAGDYERIINYDWPDDRFRQTWSFEMTKFIFCFSCPRNTKKSISSILCVDHR